MLTDLVQRIMAWCSTRRGDLRRGATLGALLALRPGLLAAQEEFGGGDAYWGDALTTILRDLCPVFEILQPVTLFVLISLACWWSLGAARGQSHKWKWVVAAILTMGFVYNPYAWFNLFGMSWLQSRTGWDWSQCLFIG